MTNQSKEIFAGVMPIELTPPIGAYLDGYGARKEPSNDIHDPLFATLLAIKSGDTGVALVTMDLVAVALSFTQRVRAAIAPILGLPQENILVAASHSHAGPVGFLGKAPMLSSAEDPVLQELAIRRLTGAAIWVKDHLQPALISFGQGEVHEIGRNRNDPVNGLTDYEVIVLRVDRASGEPLAVVMNYGCHPTVLGADNLAISADYPGAARASLNKVYPETAFLFANGATGDVSTRFTRRGQGFEEVQRMGNILAGEVLKVMQRTTPMGDVTLSGKITSVNLPYRKFPTVEAAQKQVKEFEADLARQRAAGLPGGEVRKAVTRLEGAQAQLAMANNFYGTTFTESQVQALRIGPLAFLSLPGEPFTQNVKDIKQRSPVHPTAVVSYGNDYCGYFPDAVSVAAGTYESLISPFNETIGEQLTQVAVKLLEN
jgi:neutral ceramidase